MRKSRSNFVLWNLLILTLTLLLPSFAYSKPSKFKSLSKNHKKVKSFNRVRSSKLLSSRIKKPAVTYIGLAKNKFNIRIQSTEYLSWGVAHVDKSSTINLLPAWEKFIYKKDVVVAVIDTGIDPKHPFLQNNIYVKRGKRTSENYGIDFSKNRKYIYRPKDTHGHGTHVAGIIRSVFPKVNILALKYYNKSASGQANLSSTIEALRYAVDNGVDIINYSGGGPEPSIEELSILKKAESKGILVVAAAGNENSNIDLKSNAYYPASYGLNNIITVASHNRFHKILPSSNYGKKSVDISAPGHRIKSALPKNRSGYLTGTSQATAFVSGVASLLKSQFPKLSAKDLKSLIIRSAKKDIRFMNKISSGGELNAGRAITLAIKEHGLGTNTKTRSVAFLKKKKGRSPKSVGRIIYRKSLKEKRQSRN